MANETQETLYRIFEALSGGLVGGLPRGDSEAPGQSATEASDRAQAVGGTVAVTLDAASKGPVADAVAGAVIQAVDSSGAGTTVGQVVPGTVARSLESATGGGISSVLGGGGLVGAIESAVTGSSPKKSDGGVGDAALSVLKSGLGVVPLASLLFGLFGGNDKEEPPALTKYALPARRSFEAAETAFGLANVDYDQSGRPRVVDGGSGAAGSAPQITVNVQAMDARSFLDRSSDIAAAVREAMLNLNSINDVVTDL